MSVCSVFDCFRPEVLRLYSSSIPKTLTRCVCVCVCVFVKVKRLLCSQMELITQQAMRAGFTGGVVVDYPNSTRAKKSEPQTLVSVQLHILLLLFTTVGACKVFECFLNAV